MLACGNARAFAKGNRKRHKRLRLFLFLLLLMLMLLLFVSIYFNIYDESPSRSSPTSDVYIKVNIISKRTSNNHITRYEILQLLHPINDWLRRNIYAANTTHLHTQHKHNQISVVCCLFISCLGCKKKDGERETSQNIFI